MSAKLSGEQTESLIRALRKGTGYLGLLPDKPDLGRGAAAQAAMLRTAWYSPSHQHLLSAPGIRRLLYQKEK